MKPAALLIALVLSGLGVTAAVGQPAPVTLAPQGRANLNISPKRVTFDRSHRSGSIYIFNQGDAAATFDISLVDRVMLPDGQILALADALANPLTKAVAERVKSARDLLQLSPKRVTLNPGQGQTIRLRVAGAPDDPAVAELRSHLTIVTIPPRESGTTAEAAAANTAPGELRFTINALFGLSVPAIVRLGDPDVKAGLQNASLTFEAIGDKPVASAPLWSAPLEVIHRLCWSEDHFGWMERWQGSTTSRKRSSASCVRLMC